MAFSKAWDKNKGVKFDELNVKFPSGKKKASKPKAKNKPKEAVVEKGSVE